MDDRSADDILALTTPRALFGDAAGDIASLKRAYAALVRRFRPDSSPAVFAHVHALFGAARAALEAGPPSDGAGPVVQVLEVGPGRAVVVAPARTTGGAGAAETIADWLEAVARDGCDASGWGRLSRLLSATPWTDEVEVAERVIAELDAAPVQADRAVLPSLRRATRWLAWARASRDLAVPRSLVRLLADAEGEPAPGVVRALLAYGEQVSEAEADRLQRLLERRHPGALRLLHELLSGVIGARGAESAGATLAALSVPEHLTQVARRVAGTWTLTRRAPIQLPLAVETKWMMAGTVFMVMLVTSPWPTSAWAIALRLAGVVLGALVVGVARHVGMRDWPARVAAHRVATLARRRSELEAELTYAAVGAGLFPAEVVHLLRCAQPPELVAEDGEDVAAWFVMSELRTLRWLRPQHVVRVDARVRAGA